MSLHFELTCGASGDMLLASLVDLGVPVRHLQERLGELPIPGLKIASQRPQGPGGGLAGARALLSWDEGAQQEYRNLEALEGLLAGCSWPPEVVERTRKVLTRLAEVEARVHGVSLHEVHFHEIGAVDTIADIGGFCLALDYLGESSFSYSTLTVGNGSVQTAHGLLPVPVPATAALIEGRVVRQLATDTEILTPTGAALLTTLGRQDSTGFFGRIVAVGVGCGQKSIPGHPNILRVFRLEGAASGRELVILLESDMDHLSGEAMGFAAERLAAAGALDVSWAPIFMKKGRPGYRLTVMCRPGQEEALAEQIVRHTRTLGVRESRLTRYVAARDGAEIELLGERGAEKVCEYRGYVFSKPEYELLARVARRLDRPLQDVLEEYIRSRGR